MKKLAKQHRMAIQKTILKSLTLSAAVVITVAISAAPASAQQGCGGLPQGYGFGVGLGNSAVQATRFLSSHDRPPHFSLFPPVYYSDVITPRPYGISPFAAPAGIRPVELDMMIPLEPITFDNPYYQSPSPSDQEPEVTTASTESDTTSSNDHVQWIDNPFFSGRSLVGQ